MTCSLCDEKTKEREIAGVMEAMEMYSLKNGLILTENDCETLKFEDGKVIEVLPIEKWLLI